MIELKMHLVTRTVSYIYQESDVGARDNTSDGGKKKKEIGAPVTYQTNTEI